jgi:hypothetical protein
MDRYEEAVMEYITASKHRFVSPQFDIPYENTKGGSCPDFVVLDYQVRTVYVVEVTSSSNISTLLSRVDERGNRWLHPVRKYLTGLNNDFAEWAYRVSLFVRKDNFESFKIKLEDYTDVSVFALEDISFPYSWDWSPDGPINPL